MHRLCIIHQSFLTTGMDEGANSASRMLGQQSGASGGGAQCCMLMASTAAPGAS